ncbi:Gfo/Idh/MocA family protein [Halopiger xanaduensis]|uniref:Oxidoreductase domain protein n=1 Tax=Halopiger xanaduensis (strain DSM 18323 / JCM 14033 / SH-6) TaxID=797210 RepID=F8D7H9_HALXS|nr:Gfo/Idh/MocA family oxidoreductase [Halopiger xanaduensis]AEH36209.1 oxidoreductase domain protein [Halopiger xanaduensis SH-6]
MTLTAGIVGCGTIADAYCEANDRFDSYRIAACADLERERAEATAAEYGLEARSVEDLLVDPDIDIAINLTPPTAHAGVILQALEADTHVYTEKPLATDLEDAEAVLETADERGLRVGSAPDTVLGAGLQTARAVLEAGRIGRPIGATANLVFGGHESWHPNPDLYYQEGGGPLFDMGPYYVGALIALLGPAERVTGATGRAFEERTIGSGPRAGESIDVEVPTHEVGVVTFENGAIANLQISFDAVGGTSGPSPLFELYGTEGTLQLPDPNDFDGAVRVRERGADEFETVRHTHDYTAGRGVGVADLARSLQNDDWEHRTSGRRAYHTLEIMAGVRTAAEREEHVRIESACERPAPLPETFPK